MQYEKQKSKQALGWRGKKIIRFGIVFKYSSNVWIFNTRSYISYQVQETLKYAPIYVAGDFYSLRKKSYFQRFFSSKLIIINDKVNWALKDLVYHINFTLAEAKISRQKSSIMILYKVRRRGEMLYRCRYSQTQNEHNYYGKAAPGRYWTTCD